MGVKSYIFGRSKSKANTFIGGVASTINTPQLLASRLNIAVGRITMFSVVGNNIECSIMGSYEIPAKCWESDSNITSYLDNSGLVINGSVRCFRLAINLERVNFPNLVSLIDEDFWGCHSLKELILPSLTSWIGGYTGLSFMNNLIVFKAPLIENITFTNNNIFKDMPKLRFIIVPNMKYFGNSALRENVIFNGTVMSGLRLVCHSFTQTSNSGAEEGDIAFARAGGASISYAYNETAPNTPTMSIGQVLNTAIQINAIAPISTNAIDYYEVYVNGVFNQNIISGVTFFNLTPNTSYNITLVAVDIFYNKSLPSAVVIVSTTNVPINFYADTNEATAYINAAALVVSAEIESVKYIIFQLLNNSLLRVIQAMYLFKGSSAVQHSFNAKNPQNTNAAFRLAFFGGGTHSALGYQGNGTNAYANSFFVPSANQNVNSNGMTIVVGTNDAVVGLDAHDIGAYISNFQVSALATKANNSDFKRLSIFNNNPTRISISGPNEARGIFTGLKTASNLSKMFRNQSLIATGTGGGTLPTVPIWIGALNINNSIYGASNQRIQMALFHEGLTDAQTIILHQIIDFSENIAGRKTW